MQNQEEANSTPSFDNPESLQRPSLMAQAQLFQAIRFQCRTCGLRIDSGEAYRQHLDQHFALASGQAGSHLLNNQAPTTTMVNGANQSQPNGTVGIASNASNKRPKYLNFNEFVRAKQSSRRDADFVPFEGNTLCHVCSAQIDVTLDENDEVVLTRCKKVTIQQSAPAETDLEPQKVVIVHSHCFEALGKLAQTSDPETTQAVAENGSSGQNKLSDVRQFDIEKLKSFVKGRSQTASKRMHKTTLDEVEVLQPLNQSVHANEEVKESEQKRVKK